MIVKFNLFCGLVNSQGPEIEIQVNHKVVSSLIADCAEFTIDLDINNDQTNEISFIHKNKTDHDTIVLDNQIVEDKFFKVTKIWADDILLPDLLCYGQATIIYSDSFLKDINYTPERNCKSDSLYFNGQLTYTLSKNLFDWLYEYHRQQDLEYIQGHHDHEAEEKYLGYQQDSDFEQEIVDLLENHGYCITR